ncbi:MAG: GNAT family N-acyltransferase, partial [Candidatus Aenigmatarchaeota archaeon]
IGTYRLLLGSVAKKNFGFYSELEFNLKNIIKNCKGEILEVSRFCLNSNYKKYILVSFMWKMLLKYIENYKIRYIFGCVSIEDYDPLKIGKFLYFFQENYFSSSKFRVYPNFLNRYDYVKSLVRINKEKIYKILPPLLRIYLKTGAVVCGEPAFDNYFDVVDFFMLLDTKKMNIEFVRRLIGNNNLFKKL